MLYLVYNRETGFCRSLESDELNNIVGIHHKNSYASVLLENGQWVDKLDYGYVCPEQNDKAYYEVYIGADQVGFIDYFKCENS